ncbi:hypothetical protein NEUTE1DRAFT_44696 [Neurospora tetrasperma FGSC 2508]|uniref:Zn(2)-C6 fungal-type domain-containing protein n=1 Tax=Neurospora tetrasperma (strain FGSC 2508 / ATCC MYA-4615 / P0657) TaxID=510951 RepID=F8MNE2_NEUT8|nr:uncharacterized protein NEUTE1DRAFT_44696 [Neurospora tetrasperma FGSC 2508]EGO56117.1 hypothetical protein NEUTE1DRAFT_44696 [Neurospora tetrasperma FGSC 2508]EGZ71029.1 hypothetical protein NEUTE2DRAFT_69605 [Neurospora tetrasperma FGSC 2509]
MMFMWMGAHGRRRGNLAILPGLQLRGSSSPEAQIVRLKTEPGTSTKQSPRPSSSSNATSAAGSSNRPVQPPKVCDKCRLRRIRCDYQSPCQPCIDAKLQCTRNHVPRKRGPRPGRGRLINRLREREAGKKEEQRPSSSGDPEVSDGARSNNTDIFPQNASVSSTWASDVSTAPETTGLWANEHIFPSRGAFLYLIPKCVELFYQHLYPVMPVLYMPEIQRMDPRVCDLPEKNLLFSLSALTCFRMSGHSLGAEDSPEFWDQAGRFLLNDCLDVRKQYDLYDNISLSTVVSSMFLASSFFETNQSTKAWVYLREALTFAQELGLEDESTYAGLSPEEALCRQRVFWLLYVMERSFAILRNKPLMLRRTPKLPMTLHAYESRGIHTGFLQLLGIYIPLRDSIIEAWTYGSNSTVDVNTYLALQNQLARPAGSSGGLSIPHPFFPSSPNAAVSSIQMPVSQSCGFSDLSLSSSSISSSPEDPVAPVVEPTPSQTAELLVTQQWLRLIIWLSSLRQGYLSWAAENESMHFALPLTIARQTGLVLRSLMQIGGLEATGVAALEVNGMGIFEKIFEIGAWCMNVLDSYDKASLEGQFLTLPNFGRRHSAASGKNKQAARSATSSPADQTMDYEDDEDVDLLDVFMRALSATPTSRKQFAEPLYMWATTRPGGMRIGPSSVLHLNTGGGAGAFGMAQAQPGLTEQIPGMGLSQGLDLGQASGIGAAQGHDASSMMHQQQQPGIWNAASAYAHGQAPLPGSATSSGAGLSCPDGPGPGGGQGQGMEDVVMGDQASHQGQGFNIDPRLGAGSNVPRGLQHASFGRQPLRPNAPHLPSPLPGQFGGPPTSLYDVPGWSPIDPGGLTRARSRTMGMGQLRGLMAMVQGGPGTPGSSGPSVSQAGS